MHSWPEVYLPKLSSRFALPALALRDTSTGKVAPLELKDHYRMYVCGITPYDATHLGHAATYLTFDLINRYLRATGASVNFVENITDIDDPLLERANRDGVDWRRLAESQIDLFRADMATLHILPPENYIGVIEAMPLVLSAIERLRSADTTYLVDGDLYFRVRSDREFGDRSHYSQEKMVEIFSERGGDPHRVGKEDPLDALIWHAQREGEPGWESPYGKGRPGWHIECSAIALHYLQPLRESEYAIDIQGGGSDLIFPHHEMSASQGRVIGNQKFARTYVHTGMIGLDGEKMSKSLGNLIFVSQLMKGGVNPMAIRWALMDHHYSTDLMWDSQLLDSAENEIEDLRLFLAREDVAPTDLVIQEIIIAMSKDLDTERALGVLRNWMRATEAGESGGVAGELSRAIDTLLGIAL